MKWVINEPVLWTVSLTACRKEPCFTELNGSSSSVMNPWHIQTLCVCTDSASCVLLCSAVEMVLLWSINPSGNDTGTVWSTHLMGVLVRHWHRKGLCESLLPSTVTQRQVLVLNKLEPKFALQIIFRIIIYVRLFTLRWKHRGAGMFSQLLYML